MDRRKRGPSFRPWLASLAAALLAACQQGFPLTSQAPESAVPAWRVVERLGEARYLAPSMAGWDYAVPGGLIPAGSQITTGIGGRLILTRADDQLSASTSSRFILPDATPGGRVRQTTGSLRYRIASAGSASFDIETPFLDLAVDDAVVDVTVRDGTTEVAVVSGRVHVSTRDGRRQIDLDTGYHGYASLRGNQLAVRRGAGEELEKVPSTVVPAVHPARSAERTIGNPVGQEPHARPADRSDVSAASTPDAAETLGPHSNTFGRSLLSSSIEEVAAIPASDFSRTEAGIAPPDMVSEPAPFMAIDEAQANRPPRRFDLLTEGLLDGLSPAQHPEAQLDRR